MKTTFKLGGMPPGAYIPRVGHVKKLSDGTFQVIEDVGGMVGVDLFKDIMYRPIVVSDEAFEEGDMVAETLPSGYISILTYNCDLTRESYKKEKVVALHSGLMVYHNIHSLTIDEVKAYVEEFNKE